MAITTKDNQQISTEERVREIRKEIERKEKEKKEQEKELERIKKEAGGKELEVFLKKKSEIESWRDETKFKMQPLQEEVEEKRKKIVQIDQRKGEIELEEKATENPEKMREIEKRRWKVEDERRSMEKEAWEIEDRIEKAKEKLARIESELAKIEDTRKEEELKQKIKTKEELLEEKKEEIASFDEAISDLRKEIAEEKSLERKAEEKKEELFEKLRKANSHLQRKRITASFDIINEVFDELHSEERLMEKVRLDNRLENKARELKEEIEKRKEEEEDRQREKEIGKEKEEEKKRKEQKKISLKRKMEDLSSKANVYFHGADYDKALSLAQKIIQTLESPTQEEDVFDEVKKETTFLADMKELKEKAEEEIKKEREKMTEEERRIDEKRRKQKKEKEEKEKAIMLENALAYYNEGEFSDAKKVLYKLLEKTERTEKRGFIKRFLSGATVSERAMDLLKKIREKEGKKGEIRVPAPKEEEKKAPKEEEKKAPKEEEKKDAPKKKKGLSQKNQLEAKIEKAYEQYKKDDKKAATSLLLETVKELEEEEKKATLIKRTRVINPLIRKAKRLLSKIKEEEEEKRKRERKKKERMFQIKYNKAKEQFENKEFSLCLQTSKELLGEIKGVNTVLEKKVNDLIEKVETEQEKARLIKKHEEELKAQREELRKKQEEEIKKEREKLQEKEKEISKKEPTMRKEAMEDVLQKEKIQAVKREMEKQKDEIIKKYEEEMKRREKELKQKQEEEFKRREAEIKATPRVIRETAAPSSEPSVIKEVEVRPETVRRETTAAPLEERARPEGVSTDAPRKEVIDDGERTRALLSQIELQKRMEEELEKKKERLIEGGSLDERDREIIIMVDRQRENLDRWASKIREFERRQLTPEEEEKKKEAEKTVKEELEKRRNMIEEAERRIEERKAEKKAQREEEEKEKREQEKYGRKMENPETWKKRAETETRRRKLREEVKKRKEQRKRQSQEGVKGKEESEEIQLAFKEALDHYNKNELHKALDMFYEIKEQLPEPKEEPGFFSKLLGRISFYSKVEDYIQRTEKKIAIEEMQEIKKIRKRARQESKEKTAEEKQAPAGRKGKGKGRKKLPFSSFRGIFKRIFLSNPIVGVDISDYSIEILYMSKTGSVLAYGRSIIDRGAVQAGEIKDQKILSEAIIVLSRRQGFKSLIQGGDLIYGLLSVSLSTRLIPKCLSLNLKKISMNK